MFILDDCCFTAPLAHPERMRKACEILPEYSIMDTDDSQRQATPTLAKPRRPRKFRSSCDACSASKVKCDQKQPECLRCTNLGLRCNYSLSRRMGKPLASSHKSTNSSRRSTSENEKQRRPCPAQKSECSSNHVTEVPQAEAPTRSHKQCSSNLGLIEMEDFMLLNWQDDLFQMSAFNGPSTADISLDATNVFDPGVDFMEGSTKQLADDNKFDFGDEISQTSRVASRDPIYETSQHFLLLSAHSDKITGPSSHPASSKLCSHQPDFSHTLQHSAYPQASISIDQVLINNKAAIENALTLLSCPCSHNPHIALSLALICSNILAMYEAIIKTSRSSSTSPSTRSTVWEGGGITPIPVTIGAYRIDEEDEERMRTQIVVNELRKVSKLVDKYASKYCTTADGEKRDEAETMYSALEAFLRSKLTTAMRDTLAVLE